MNPQENSQHLPFRTVVHALLFRPIAGFEYLLINSAAYKFIAVALVAIGMLLRQMKLYSFVSTSPTELLYNIPKAFVFGSLAALAILLIYTWIVSVLNRVFRAPTVSSVETLFIMFALALLPMVIVDAANLAVNILSFLPVRLYSAIQSGIAVASYASALWAITLMCIANQVATRMSFIQAAFSVMLPLMGAALIGFLLFMLIFL